MADTQKPARILTDRGLEIFHEFEIADSNRDLLRCLAEAIAFLEHLIDETDRALELKLLATKGDDPTKFKFYEDEKK